MRNTIRFTLPLRLFYAACRLNKKILRGSTAGFSPTASENFEYRVIVATMPPAPLSCFPLSRHALNLP